ncbi:MAG: SusD/RagB family nutrient-binding outer membrane lipoprotein, partial [Chitinophagia bacterium]|nr:SusD/RagB family nutrient-binding outer membrane lipoprotein [Chitinophagia bacterium]
MKRIATIALVALAFTSCEKFVDVNTNPNTPTVTKANYVFSNALNNAGRIVAGGLHITGGHWTGYYAHSTSFTGGGQEKTYVFTNNDFNFFDGIYDNLADFQYVIDKAQADGVGHLIGPSMIMQAMVMQKLVDIYGNVPFTEALKGTAFTEPKYDDAATIYGSLMKMLTDGQAKVSAASFPISDPSDVFFNANKTRWMQLANTVKMRLIVRRSNVSGYTPGADLGTITADGVIAAPVFCNPGYLKTAGKLNPYYQNWGFNENDAPTGDFRKMNRVIVEWLKGSNDVFRLQRICSVKGLSDNL